MTEFGADSPQAPNKVRVCLTSERTPVKASNDESDASIAGFTCNAAQDRILPFKVKEPKLQNQDE